MDLLGSILGNMEAPPTVDEKQRKRNKENRQKLKLLEEREQQEKSKFRKEIKQKIEKFVSTTEENRLKLQPMNKLQRSIVHDVAEVAHLLSQAFGHEEDGRYIILFKKDKPPSEAEINAYRLGKEWDPTTHVVDEENKKEKNTSKKDVSIITPNFNYKDKYSHIIGTSSAKDAAKITEAKKNFGMVPSASKRDIRSVEQTMNELREKRRKMENDKKKNE